MDQLVAERHKALLEGFEATLRGRVLLDVFALQRRPVLAYAEELSGAARDELRALRTAGYCVYAVERKDGATVYTHHALTNEGTECVPCLLRLVRDRRPLYERRACVRDCDHKLCEGESWDMQEAWRRLPRIEDAEALCGVGLVRRRAPAPAPVVAAPAPAVAPAAAPAAVPAAAAARAEPPDDSCAICLEPRTPAMTAAPCGHVFHPECLEEWARRSPTCPLCRSDLE